MSTHLARAEMLLQQSRPAEAEREARLALAEDPENAFAHALLALSGVAQERAAEALASAQTAIGLAPATAYMHYVHAYVLHRLDRSREALAAIDEAIRLSPEDEESFALRASIQLARRDWTAALADAEAGLKINPEHVRSANLRAMALVNLGRKAEAAATGEYALQRDPQNALAHANQGWTCLHRNEPRQAQVHFREALRLDPELEYARHGMLEALKARNPLYRGMLAYFLWIGRQSGRVQWAFIIGSYVVMRFVRGAAVAAPQLGWLLWPLVGAFYLFVYLSWTAVPMFNLLLRFDRFGRFVLSRDERFASNWFGGAVAATLGFLAWWALDGGEIAMFCAIAAAVISVCVAAGFLHRARNRRILLAATAALAVLGATGIWMAAQSMSIAPLMAFFIGFLGFQFLANALGR